MKNNVIKIIFYLSLFLVWQVIVWTGMLPSHILPGPGQVLASLFVLVQDGSLLNGMLISLARLFAAYVTAIVGGVLIGIVISHFEWMESTVGSLALALQTLPSICWLPLAVIWFGASETAIFFVVVIGAILS